MSVINLHTSPIQPVHLKEFEIKKVNVDVLRLDLVHPVVSGNKWFKLKEYLKDALLQNKKEIVTFGGAYSNHIVATAAACKELGLQATGIIRGEKPTLLSPTLQQAIGFGMQLHFINREAYRKKELPLELLEKDIYLIDEGGYGIKGMLGAKTIVDGIDPTKYTHICTAAGTGTTLAGLIEASKNAKCMGISVLKNNLGLKEEINALLSNEKKNRFDLLHDFHFGGYAKFTSELIAFMNEWYLKTAIPSDFVYTGKLFFAVNHLIEHNYFAEHSRVLIIHSGGLQGNRSLSKGTLIFGD